MSLLFRKAGEQFFDNNGDPLAGGYLVYKDATTDLVTDTWTDSGLTVLNAEEIELDASGRLADPVYISTTGVKELLYNSLDELIYSQDDYPGEVAISSTPGRVMRTVTGTTDITAADKSKFIILDSTTGSFTVTFDAATELGSDFWVELYFDTSAANPVTWALDAADTAIIPGGTATSGQFTSSGQRILFVCDGNTIVASDAALGYETNYQITATANASNLTLELKHRDGTAPSTTRPIALTFRDVSQSSSSSTRVLVSSAVSLTITNGSTLGAVNNQAFNLWALLFNDGGTVRLGVFQALNSTTKVITPLPDVNVGSATAEGGAGGATSSGTIYAAVAVSSKAFIVAARLEYSTGLSTAGAWAAAPTKMEPLPASRPGDLISSSQTQTGTSISGNTAMPDDNTIPQITEGFEVITNAHTPRCPASVLDVGAVLFLSGPSAGTVTMAMFRDATANALIASQVSLGSGQQISAPLRTRVVTSASASTTFRVRAGAPTTSVVYVNTATGSARFAGVGDTTLYVTETMS